MTAEVAILNVEGVVLAADSAVTLDAVDGQKALPRASKIYALSDVWPVAVMVYGSARFAEVPWETLVKEFRHTHGARSRPNVDDFAKDFLEWLAASVGRFPPRALERMLRGYARAWAEEFVKAVVAKLPAGEQLTATVVRKAVETTFSTKQSRAASSVTNPSIAGLSEGHLAAIHSGIEDAIESVPMTKAQRRRLNELISSSIGDVLWLPWSGSSGLVFAGFGESQWLPAIVHHEVGVLLPDGSLKTGRVQRHEVGNETRSAILPFAQADEIHAFLRGIHPNFVKTFRRDLSADEKKVFASRLDEIARTTFLRSILDMVAILPREELAVMAETLVNLCAFRQRLSGNLETVAGPVDVAVLSKGDGLVWVRRKHYFPPELNPKYFQRQTNPRS